MSCNANPILPVPSHNCIALAEQLNIGCQCVSLDRDQLRAELENTSPGFYAEVIESRPHLFADSLVFVSGAHVHSMAATIAAIERVVALPAYQAHVMQHAPQIARHQSAARGVFLGYDFHLGPLEHSQPQLIEINTNAGGGMLNAVLERAQYRCCDVAAALLPGLLGADTPEHLFLEMFRAEWRAARGKTPLRSIAIVDNDPATQYLHPEFVLFQRLFERNGMHAVICDPRELQFRQGEQGGLWHAQTRIDLVYCRLTDFSLEESAHAALRDAYLADAVVLTPHPRAHALYADKRNLAVLCDDTLLAAWGVDADTRKQLTDGIPRTERVDPARADEYWARRKQLFFKPAGGYGGKAAYRGDKLTRRVFEEIMAGASESESEYVAQALVTPSARRLDVAGEAVELKLDLRNYVYDGRVQLIAARLYRGQTTNFRTPGGGFAPVLEVPCGEDLP
ncbi:MAG: hypothetical protein HY066_06640 [Betaproteobacteria bacterium]|nr:hypothetical protein [Betaproteobacteria bacterium]